MGSLADKATSTLRREGPAAVARKSLRYPLKPLFARGAANALREASEDVHDPGELYRLVQGFNHRGISIRSWQLESEIVRFLELLAERPPARILEIGTAQGGTLFLLSRAARPDARIISVDLPGGEVGGVLIERRYSYPRWRSRMYAEFAREEQQMHVLRGDSHSTATHDAVRRILGGDRLDLLFVDGDHSYEGVRQDYERYSPLVREGGLVAFHDIVPGAPGKRGDPGGVPAFWQDVKGASSASFELVQDWEWGSCGIGVLRR
jgi:predicted O-methyltransferase YrrM